MADSFAQYETLLREYVPGAVTDLVLKDDDPAWNLIGTFEPHGVGGRREYDATASDYPAGYEARFKIKSQLGGRVTAGTFAGNTLTMMGKDSHLAMGQAADAKYLDPRKTPLRAHIPIIMELMRIKGSVTQNHQQIMADLAADPIEEVAAGSTEDAVKRFRGYVMNCFYGNGTPTIAQVNAASPTDPTETAGGVSVTIDGGTWGRFMKGDLIVFGSDADPRVQVGGNISGYARIVAIDQDLRTIKVQSELGEGTLNISDNDHIMLADAYNFSAASTAAGSLVPEGAESLLINSGVFPGSTSPGFTSGLDVSHHTELKSFITDTTTAMDDPTMDAVTVLLDKILDLDEDPPSAFIAERSLWTYHAQLERENHAMIQVPMGATFQAAGGVAGPVLGHQEYRFQRFNSKRIRPNSILGLNPRVWMKYIPMGDRVIHWVYGSGPLAGIQSIFGPTFDGTQLTELVDAPFNAYFQFGCKDPRLNFRRLGLKNQRDV